MGILQLLGGLLLTVGGLSLLALPVVGEVTGGRAVFVASGVVFLLAAASLLVMPFKRRAGRAIGALAAVAFAATMLVMVFDPSRPPPAAIYRIAAVALAVLVVARLWLGRSRRSGD